jgi:hypothetical protein
MTIVLTATVLALFFLVMIWLLPSWPALYAQFGKLFPDAPAADTAQPLSRPAQRLRAARPPPLHAGTRLNGGKRHTVLPHQARGR